MPSDAQREAQKQENLPIKHIVHRFKAAEDRGDPERMRGLMDFMAVSGTPPHTWMTRHLVNTISRTQGADAVFAAAEELQRGGYAFDASVYYALLQSCLQAQQPPYGLDERFAEQALSLFRQAQAAYGAELDPGFWRTLLDCQARAALPDAAHTTLREAKACGVQNGVRLYNLVVIAYARAGRAAEAEAFVREDMEADGITPDIVTWNSLLRAFGNGDNMDAAYRVWQDIQRAGLAVDHITQVHLSHAFASNPTLAAELMAEAATLASNGSLAAQVGRIFAKCVHQHQGHSALLAAQQWPPERKTPCHLCQPDAQVAATGTSEDESSEPQTELRQYRMNQPAAPVPSGRAEDSSVVSVPRRQLDLHGMSVPTARVAILRWLDHVAAWVAQQPGGRLPESHCSFAIITGRGLHSNPHIGGVLMDATSELLRRQQLPFSVKHHNVGKVDISAGDMVAWSVKRGQQTRKASFVHSIGLRYLAFSSIIGSVVAAAVLVPELMSG